MTQLLHSVSLPMDGYLSLGWDRERVCVAATVPGRPWTFYELGRDLTIIRSFQGGTNPSGPPQLFAPNDWRWCEMEDAPDASWPEWSLSFEHDGANMLTLTKPTGRRIRAGNLQWRDGHVVSYVAAGHLEYDLQPVPCPFQVGGVSISSNWLAAHNHGNNQINRMHADDFGAWETRDVPAFLFGQAQMAPNGSVVYSEFPDGKVSVWTRHGSVLDGEMPTNTPQNPNWSWMEDDGLYWFCSGHNGAECAFGSDSRNGYLLLAGGSEPYARAYVIEGFVTAVARWDSIAKVIRVDTLTLDQPFTEPEGPIDPPPIDPPPTGGDEMTAAECKVLLDAMEKRLTEQMAADRKAANAEFLRLQQWQEARRPLNVGGVFGTNKGELLPMSAPGVPAVKQ